MQTKQTWMSALALVMALLIAWPQPVAARQTAARSGQTASTAKTAQSASLRIVVLAGEDAVNVIQQKTAVAPLVEVRDRNDQPVAGAVVTFSIRGGRAAFAAGANTVTVTTNAAGQAAMAGLTPTGSGLVQINVAATFQGQTAAAAITQTNFATAAQAASAGSGASGGSTGAAGGGGGGGIGAGTITGLTAAAAGAVGGLYGYRKYQQGEAPNVESVAATPDVGLQGMTTIIVVGNMTWHGAGATMTGDFGDGTQATASTDPGHQRPGFGFGVEHVYNSAGTFTIRFTLTDAWERSSSAQTTVTIKSLTGNWRLGTTGSFFVLNQSGSTITGTFTAASGQGSGVVTGSTRPQPLINASVAAGLTLSVTPTGPGVPSSFTGGAFGGGDAIGGTFISGSTTITAVSLVRQ